MRVGVVGLGMGSLLATWCERLGMRVEAVCDRDPAVLSRAGAALPDARRVSDWRDLLDTGLDGVILANDFDAHAPLAVAFLDRGVHVLSETAACADEEEGRRLVEAADRSSASYSLAENYVLLPHVRLIREALPEIGRVTHVEADYLHGMSPQDVNGLIGDPGHWRGTIAPTAYCTHSLSPILALTGARPVEVTAFTADTTAPRQASVMAVRLSTGALALTRNGFLQGEPDSHWSWVSVRGERGLAESVRARGDQAWSVRVRTEGWTQVDGRPREEVRVPPELTLDGAAVDRSAEGTVLLLQAFRATVEQGAPPVTGVREAVAASLVGVAGARSLEQGSVPVPLPDLG
ncbi:Gfo/Idh/MocA family protein [Nocardiopsis eucommiae]|uniref:Gfo/Idh/MocA family protein n=1 Tax=Nocardiopsis eucommiae TaxID=2831970 RepID=UPI003D7271E9